MTVKEFYTLDNVYEGRPNDFSQMKSAELLIESIIYNSSARLEK